MKTKQMHCADLQSSAVIRWDGEIGQWAAYVDGAWLNCYDTLADAIKAVRAEWRAMMGE